MSLTVRDVMKEVSVLSPEAPVVEAAKLMKEMDVELVPIGDSNGLQGVVSPREIALSAVAGLGKLDAMPVEEITTRAIGFCREDQELRQVLTSMDKCGQPQMLVRDHEGKVVGCISRDDILHAESDHFDTAL